MANKKKNEQLSEYLQSEFRLHLEYYQALKAKDSFNADNQWKIGDKILETKGDKSKLVKDDFVMHDYMNVMHSFIIQDLIKTANLIRYIYQICLSFGVDIEISPEEKEILEGEILTDNVNNNLVFANVGGTLVFKDEKISSDLWDRVERGVDNNQLQSYYASIVSQRKRYNEAKAAENGGGQTK